MEKAQCDDPDRSSTSTTADQTFQEDTLSPKDETPVDVDDGFEEGGYGWLVILGSWFCQITSMGVGQSWGVMQDYYAQHDFHNLSNAATLLPFVGTVLSIFFNLMGAPAQILTSVVGYRATLIVGVVLKVAGLIISGWAKEPWQLIICQGIIFGSGASITFCVVMAVAPAWFRKHRALALGLLSSGSGAGGVIMPLMMESINASLGPAWTYRILGFMVLGMDTIAVLLIKEKNPPKERKRKRLTDIFHLQVLKDANYLLYCMGSMIALLGYFEPFFFLPAYATYVGLSAKQGSALIAVISGCNFFGRIIIGFIADRCGKVNTNITFTILGGLSSLLIWTFAFNYATLMAFAVVFGLTCASYFALLSTITVQLVGLDRFPSALSILLLTNIISGLGPNFSSWVEQAVGATNPFFSYKMFSGVCYLVGAVFLIMLKFRLDRRPWAKV